MGRKTFDRHTDYVKGKDGVVESESHAVNSFVVKTENEPSFVKCYLHDISLLHKIPKQCESVLWELLTLMDYKNRISLSAYNKREICEKLGLYKKDSSGVLVANTNMIDQQLTRLTKAELFIKIGTGTYEATSNIFGKGQWKDIKHIRVAFNYAIAEKRRIEAEIQNEKK